MVVVEQNILAFAEISQRPERDLSGMGHLGHVALERLVENLTLEEIALVDLQSLGHSLQDAATKLNKPYETLKEQNKSVLRKLGVGRIHGAVYLLLEAGQIELSDEEIDLGPEKAQRLTNKPREALGYLMLGLIRKDVAAKMEVGEETIKQHLKTIFAKFEVDSVEEAVRVGFAGGIRAAELKEFLEKVDTGSANAKPHLKVVPNEVVVTKHVVKVSPEPDNPVANGDPPEPLPMIENHQYKVAKQPKPPGVVRLPDQQRPPAIELVTNHRRQKKPKDPLYGMLKSAGIVGNGNTSRKTGRRSRKPKRFQK